jgi:hypothetical protein
LSYDEVLDSVRALPAEIKIGEGRDARTFFKRGIEDSKLPRIVGGLHGPIPEHLVRIIPKCFAEIPQSDIIEGFNMVSVDGREVHGIPIAAYTARREASLMREAVRAAGRLGMAVTLYPIHTDAATMIAPLDPEHCLRRTDGAIFSVLPDLKVEFGFLTVAIVYEEYGAFKENRGITGSFFTSVGGCIVGGIAHAIASWIIYRNRLIGFSTGRPGLSSLPSSPRRRISGGVWPFSLANMTLDRNSDMIRMGGVGRGNLGCLSNLISISFRAIVSTILGGGGLNVDRIVNRTDPTIEFGGTPVETELASSVSEAVVRSGMNRRELEPILRELEDRHWKIDVSAEKTYAHSRFLDIYDPNRHKPVGEYQEKVDKIKEDLREMGLDTE